MFCFLEHDFASQYDKQKIRDAVVTSKLIKSDMLLNKFQLTWKSCSYGEQVGSRGAEPADHA